MSTTYQKPFLSFEAQLQLLKARGLGVTDEATAVDYLRRIGYYRLSAYWYPFREASLQQDPISASTFTSCGGERLTGSDNDRQ